MNEIASELGRRFQRAKYIAERRFPEAKILSAEPHGAAVCLLLDCEGWSEPQRYMVIDDDLLIEREEAP